VEIQVSHLTGRDDEASVRAAYQAAGVPAEVIAFTKYMAPLYHAADLAICRAGGSTCAELAYFGVPALFVPYPLAAMDHQTANARALEKRGTADMVAESDLTPEWLEAYLAQTVHKPERLARLREAARKEGVKDGTAALASLVEACARKP
jgi:UDP-N-acetylglucosamine--N-acetylmuramyl-(pentapeptide) pyrophosphoryl-undecaprenol N-acetylglucosamine transferase